MQASCRIHSVSVVLVSNSGFRYQGACGSERLPRNPVVEGKVRVEIMIKKRVSEISFVLHPLSIRLVILFIVDEYDARGHHETDTKFSDVDSASGGYPMHSFMAIPDTHILDSGSAQYSVPPISDGIMSLSSLEAPAVVVPLADAIAIPEETRPSVDAIADSASSLPFSSGGASILTDISGSVPSESLVAEVQSENAAAEDTASAFAFLTS